MRCRLAGGVGGGREGVSGGCEASWAVRRLNGTEAEL